MRMGFGAPTGIKSISPMPEQLFGTGTIEDGAAVHLTGHREGDALGMLALDQAR